MGPGELRRVGDLALGEAHPGAERRQARHLPFEVQALGSAAPGTQLQDQRHPRSLVRDHLLLHLEEDRKSVV